MEAMEIVGMAFQRIEGSLGKALNKLTEDELHRQPQSDCNSIAWLAWHLTRVQDHHLSDLAGLDQVWTEDGWHAKFSMDPDPENVGWGHTPEQVANFRAPNAGILHEYYCAVLNRSRTYLANLQPEDLMRVLDEPQWNETVTVGIRLVSVMNDNTEHMGQINYLRGLFGGIGWRHR